MISPNSTRTSLSESSADHALDADRLVPVWGGVLHEFRNHLKALMTATLLALVDASVRTFEPLISSLGEVVDRAVRLAAPAAGRRLSLTTHVPREVGVRNRGAALECLMAALIIDLARADLARADLARADLARADLGGASRSPRVRVDAELGRRGLAIEIASDGVRPDPGSWRLLLATDLAAKLGATLVSQPEVAAYVIQFR
jgi:Pentapeptide repeats (8 copies)